MRSAWLGVGLIPGLLACGGLFGSVRTDLDALCTEYQAVNASVADPSQRAMALAEATRGLSLQEETLQFLMGASKTPGETYELFQEFAAENGVSDWSCPGMEQGDDADGLCVAIDDAVLAAPDQPFVRLKELMAERKLGSDVRTFADGLEALAPGQRIEAVRSFVLAQGGWRASECANDLAPYERKPEEVVKAYLELATQGKVEEAKSLISSSCLTSSIATGEPVQVFGATIQATKLEVEPGIVANGTANVPYSVQGPASAQNTQSSLLGMSFEIGSLQVDNANRTGNLTTVLEGGQWKVGCP